MGGTCTFMQQSRSHFGNCLNKFRSLAKPVSRSEQSLEKREREREREQQANRFAEKKKKS